MEQWSVNHQRFELESGKICNSWDLPSRLACGPHALECDIHISDKDIKDMIFEIKQERYLCKPETNIERDTWERVCHSDSIY